MFFRKGVNLQRKNSGVGSVIQGSYQSVKVSKFDFGGTKRVKLVKSQFRNTGNIQKKVSKFQPKWSVKVSKFDF